ncbi:MAG: Fic family protein [Ignavibacteria bacterium]|nr:Fic family protein [Ignavibacteria bacterium]
MKPFVPEKLPLENIAWEPLIPVIASANRSLAFFDGVLQGISNPALLLSPLTTQEAVLSSRIEGTEASLGDVLRFEAGEQPPEMKRQEDIREIINYRRALKQAEQALKHKPFNLNLLKELHATLLDSVQGRNMGRGKFRTEQNWIGQPGTPIEQAYFVPPEPGRVMEYLDNWEKYYHMQQSDALIQLAITHAQFEIIHPFLDGNGRIGRIIIPIFLYEKRLLSRPMFYLSAYLEMHRDTYVDRLRALGRENDAWNSWIQFFLTAVEHQARANAEKARSIINLYGRLKEQVIALTHSQFAVPLLDKMFARPVFQISQLEGKNMPTRPMIHGLVSTLKDAGILKVLRKGSGRRGQVLVLAELINTTEGKQVV